MIELQPFQRRFLRKALAPGTETSVLSLPRGNGKSRLAGHIGARIMDPADELFTPGTESVIAAASLEQSRIVFRFMRSELEEQGRERDYRFCDSYSRVEVMHKRTRTKLRLIGSSGRTAMGLTQCPWVIADEPGAWEVNGGRLLHDAIQTAQGKPQSRLRTVYIGTLAPSRDGWWHDLVKRGSHGSVYVQALMAQQKKWAHWREIMRVNPLAKKFPELAAKLREELNEAKADTRLKARFLSYRLNLPSADDSEVLLTVPDWEQVLSREIAPRQGRPIVGIDLGGGRAWSAAVGIWPNGRVEAIAVAPGVPEIERQEARDRVPRGTYSELIKNGSLRMAQGLRVPPVSMLWFAIRSAWGIPQRLICDRFRMAELQDTVGTACMIEPRVTRWSEASEDIRALRKMALDGPLSVEAKSRNLLTASLAVATVKNDDQGSCRLIKGLSNNTARDDVAVALVLASGALERVGRMPPVKYRSAIVG